VFAGAALATFGAACVEPGGDECSTNRDCPGGVCLEGVCEYADARDEGGGPEAPDEAPALDEGTADDLGPDDAAPDEALDGEDRGDVSEGDPEEGADRAGDADEAGDVGEDEAVEPAPCVPAPDITILPPFDGAYVACDLGSVPGDPGGYYGGTVIDPRDENTMLIGLNSEMATGGLYAIGVERHAAGHIIGFSGTARLIADAPYVDANLVIGYDTSDLLLYTGWPVYLYSQYRLGDSAPFSELDLRTVGLGGTSPGGIAFVPGDFTGAGGLRAVGWSGGEWYHLEYTFTGTSYDVTRVTATVTLPNGPGGIAYVPRGSPLIPNPSAMLAEWPATRVVLYEVDGAGDPIVGTRQEFLTGFGGSWGAYFEPVTGDYFFSGWESHRIIVVRGFVPPFV
jgi:hypothetical protein